MSKGYPRHTKALAGQGVKVLMHDGEDRALVLKLLKQSGHKPAMVNPRQIRNFVRATGRLAKTDALNAFGRRKRRRSEGENILRASTL